MRGGVPLQKRMCSVDMRAKASAIPSSKQPYMMLARILLLTTVSLLSGDLVATAAAIDPRLVHHFLRENTIKTVLFLACDADPSPALRLRHVARSLAVWSASVDIRRAHQAAHLDVVQLFAYRNHRVGVVADLDCPTIGSVLASVSKMSYFHQRYFWLLFAGNVSRSETMLAPQNINVDAEITVAIPTEADTNKMYDLWDVFNHSYLRGGALNLTLKYRWDEWTRPGTHPVLSKYRRRMNFNGLTLKGVLTIADIPPNYTLQEDLDSANFAHLDSMNRLNYRLFRMMEDMHNFKIYLIRSKYWGFMVNGSWIGAIGFMVRNDVDICMTALRWSPERFGFYEPTTYTYHVRVLFLFRHPKSSIEASNIFLQPFEPVVWLCTGLLGLGFAYFLRQIFLIENRRHRRMRHPLADASDLTYSNSFLMIFGILFQQSYATDARPTSARLIILSALAFALLLFQFYASFIVGSLLMESPKTIRTIQQLLDSKLECGIDEVSYIRDIFNHAIDPIAIRLYQTKIVATNNVFTLDKGLERIKRGGFAFHTDISSTYIKLKSTLSDVEICELQEIAYAKPFACGPAVPLMSPYQELIKINIRRMFETGLHAYHSAVWEQKKPKCAESSVVVAPVDLEHFSAALYILGMGIAASASMLFVEIVVHRARKRDPPPNLPNRK